LTNFLELFKKLNAGDEDVNDHDELNINEICDNPVYDEIRNGKITELEITEAIRHSPLNHGLLFTELPFFLR
jgi:hypothetical protein